MMEYKGNPVSEGIAVGKAYLYQPYVPQVTEGEISEDQAPAAVARYEELLEGAKQELAAIRERLVTATRRRYSPPTRISSLTWRWTRRSGTRSPTTS